MEHVREEQFHQQGDRPVHELRQYGRRPIRERAGAAEVDRRSLGQEKVSLRDLLDSLYRSESRRILATLIRLLGDFDLAEDALHDAFRAALEQWPKEGVPSNPRAWLVSAGRFKAIDRLRKKARTDIPLDALGDIPVAPGTVADEQPNAGV